MSGDPIARRRGPGGGQCSKAGCEEKPTITVQIRMVGYKTGQPQEMGGYDAERGTHTRGRVFCDDHADDLFERMEDLLDNE